MQGQSGGVAGGEAGGSDQQHSACIRMPYMSNSSAMQVWKDGQKVADLVGASKQKLVELVNSHTSDQATDASAIA